MKRIVIIGAGPTGLAAAYRLKELGHENFVVYEKNSFPGGLCASFKDNKGFTWDLGGHVIFSHYEYFDKLLEKALGNDYLEHKREAWIRTMRKWIPYPFQNNLRHLPKGVLLECLAGLNKVKRRNRKSANLKEWILSSMGEGIAKYFMFPYNFKVWTYPLELLSTDWISERISRVKFEEVLVHLVSNTDKIDWGPNATFKYPLHGGTGEIFEKTASFLTRRIEYNSELKRISPERKKIYLSRAREDNYGILINTAPLDKLLRSIDGCKKKLLEASLSLKHNGVFAVGVGINRPCPSNKCWVYFPDSDSPFFRATYLSNYSPSNVPDHKKYYSFLCENAYSEYKKENESDITGKTVEGLINSGLMDERDEKFIVSKHLCNIDYAYPIPTLNRDKALREIQPELEKLNIYSRGRFGAWKYEIGNTDHSVMQGKEIIDRILNGERETVFNTR